MRIHMLGVGLSIFSAALLGVAVGCSTTTTPGSGGGGSGGSGAGDPGGTLASLCEDICACEGCTSNDREACESEANADAVKAIELGCAQELDAYVDCATSDLTCDDGDAVTPGCKAEKGALNKCTGGAVGDACQQAADHLAVCLDAEGGGSDGGEPADCTGQAQCVAGCINDASCEAIKDAFDGMPSDASKSYTDCVTACASGG